MKYLIIKQHAQGSERLAILVEPWIVKDWKDAIKDQLTLDQTHGPALDTVATILEQGTQATIDDWLQRLVDEGLSEISSVDTKARSSHLSALFGELIHRLRSPNTPGSKAQQSEGAAAHGRLRRMQGYSSDILIEESRILQVSIFHTLNTNAHRVNFNLLLPDVMVIADEVDSQLAQAMASYLAAEAVASAPTVAQV